MRRKRGKGQGKGGEGKGKRGRGGGTHPRFFVFSQKAKQNIKQTSEFSNFISEQSKAFLAGDNPLLFPSSYFGLLRATDFLHSVLFFLQLFSSRLRLLHQTMLKNKALTVNNRFQPI